MNKMATEAVEQQVSSLEKLITSAYLINIIVFTNDLILIQLPVSPSLGSLSSTTVTTEPNATNIYLTFNDDKGLVLARLNMSANLNISLATTKCQVCTS